MIVSYTHADGTVESVSTDDLSAIESAVIESATGMEWDAVDTALRSQNPTAMRAVLWVNRKRSVPTLKFSDFDLAGWKRRTKARLEYPEICDMVEVLYRETREPEELDQMCGYMRTLAHEPADVDRALKELDPKAPAPAAAPPVQAEPVVVPADSASEPMS
ncbi:hypothetical protein [Streptomyces violaceusniger]|uniref:Uncharacterized protein n=1 Tax=Streptomyces violaceusniger (strain Tu 4113) TaxID=653045 RepID=G2P7D0_STRV4|nr:hypothetical protein [Streptomyces violaceusniger]AEM87090.1 hypothetical protein Strvi_7755 [Streptomyces violaceusniger Tu 4113]